MKKIIRKYKYIILFFLLFIASQFVSLLDFNFESKTADIQSFNANLFEKERTVDKWIDSILVNVKNDELSEWANNNITEIEWLYTEQGITFYVFKNGNLNYWTNNSLVVPNDTNWLNNNFIKLENAYVEVRRVVSENYHIVGLINIKNNYPYENEFLKNNFHHSFKIKRLLTIISEEKFSENSVFNKEGDYLFSLRKAEKSDKKTSAQMAFILFSVALVFLLFAAKDSFRGRKITKTRFVLFALLVLLIRFGVQYFQIPVVFYELEIFQPKYLAFSVLFPSIGELLITVLITTYLIFIFYVKVEVSIIKDFDNWKSKAKLTLWYVIFTIYAVFAYYLFEHLIVDSNFHYEAYDVLNLSVFSFFGYFIIVVLFIGLILLFDKACLQIKESLSYKKLVYITITYGLVVAFFLFLFKEYAHLISISFFILALIYWAHVRFSRIPKFSSFVVVIALFSAYATYFIREKNFHKRVDESKVLAVNLAREQDPVAEVILGDVIKNLPNDTVVTKLLSEEWFDFETLMDYVNQNYFTGYLGRYIFQLTVCNKSDSLFLDDEDEELHYCYGFFENLIKNDGVELGIPGLYYLKNVQGGINYFLWVEIPLSDNWGDVSLFFELSSKPNFEVLGYPELLLEKPLGLYQAQNKASYARYSAHQLLNTTGEFPYALDRSVYKHFDEEFAFFQSEGYDHLLYNADKDNTLIVSFPTVHFYNILISFTYIFLFLLIQVSALLILGNRFTNLIDINFSIKNKIVYSMIVILLISLLFVGGGTIVYTYRQFENNQFNILSEKIQSVLVELEHKLSHAEEIHQISPGYLNGLLVKFSNVFYSDINLYDLNGNLVGTSRSEIFERNLTSSKINSTAFRELIMNKKARIVHKENIGELEYYSAYVPFKSADNHLLAYLNLPYFSKEVVLRQELMKVVVAVINIYAFLIIISIAVAVYISNKLTQPLRMVQQRIRNINLRQENEQIEYSGNDEIAELVSEYNRMLEELDKSAKLLAKSERESAWREMARQIAHEIKNPLTPMKLSVQLLQRSWENNDADFDDRFQRFTKTLIQQIDSLSSIATAFSQFARMPISRTQRVNIVERIELSTELFKESSFIKIELVDPSEKDLYVKADKERLLQVFNNLIKNARQAIPKDKKGNIKITISKANQQVIVEINDNGIGIPKIMEDRLFEPNFTTKSSGTGLGLAIVKNIVEEIGGSIWFESSKEKGTSFYVSMPLFYEDE